MARPKGSKTKDQLDPGNILSTSRKGRTGSRSEATPATPNSAPPPSGSKTPSSKVERNTRKNYRDSNFWTNKIGPAIESIPQTKLPKNKVILQRFLDLRSKNPNTKVWVLVGMLYDEVSAIWMKARIPTKGELQCKIKIRSVIDRFFKIRHFSSKVVSEKKKAEFDSFIEKLCDIAPEKLFENLKATSKTNVEWEEDWKFYLNMCDNKQVGSMGVVDKKLAFKEERKKKREEWYDAERKKSEEEKEKKKTVSFDVSRDASSEEDDNNDPDVDVPKSPKKKKPKVMCLELDPKELVTQTCGTSDRLGLSSRDTAMILANVVKAGGGDLSNVTLSKSTVQRKKREAREEQGKAIKGSFVSSTRGYILHYDTKLVDPKGRDREDRAAVLYSGGVHKEPYLLSIPQFKSSSGKDVEEGVLAVLENYKLDIKECIGTCYDTTASNSGFKNGAHFR